MQDLIGQTIDNRFRVDSFIAAGGMGAVYRGTQLSVDRPVAIKVILDHNAAPEQVAIERFFREAQSISQLAHPNIVGLVDFGRDDKLTYLVMEFVEGVSLANLIENQYSNPAFVVETLRQIVEALAEAHAKGLVHRDLKPDNILVVKQASGALQVKVVDFGIARLQEFETISDSGAVVGTPNYMSPEQAQDMELDGRSDLFAVGVIAYEMMTGRLPFQASEPLQTMMKICNEPLPALNETLEAPELWPSELIALVGRLMEKAPEARLSSANAVIQQLEKIATKHNLKAPRANETQTLHDVAAPQLPETRIVSAVETDIVIPPPKRSRVFAGALLASLVVLSGVLFAVSMRSSEVVDVVDPPAEPKETVTLTEIRSEPPAPEPNPITVEKRPAEKETVEDAPVEELVAEPATPVAAVKKTSKKRKPKPEVVEREAPKSDDDSLQEKLKWLKSKGRD